MLVKLLIIIIVTVSCNKDINLSTETTTVSRPQLTIVQDKATPVDNMQVSLAPLLVSTNKSPSDVYIKSVFTLSKYSNSVSITVEGKYDESLSGQNITNLSSIGLVNPAGISSKGDISGLSKNLLAVDNLAYNIKVESSIYSDAALTSKLLSSSPSFIYVNGDNHYDGEILTRVPGENYYLYHEWDTNQLSAVQKLPEGNYRKISLGTTPTTKFDSLEFDLNLPKVNGYNVGYAISRTSRASYKVTNDGSGIKGWSFNSMAASFGTWGYISTGLGTSNGEADLFFQGNGHNQFNNNSFSVSTWTGGAWTANSFGNSMKTALGGTWNDTNTYVSRNFKAADNSIWLVIQEADAPAAADSMQTINTQTAYIARVKYNSGSYADPANWDKELIQIDGLNVNFKTRIRYIHVSSYTDNNNFTVYVAGDGIGKVNRVNGVISYTPIASISGSNVYDTTEDFPTGQDVNGLALIQNVLNIKEDINDPNILIFQGYTSLFSMDKRNNKITEILGKKDGPSVSYSR